MIGLDVYRSAWGVPGSHAHGLEAVDMLLCCRSHDAQFFFLSLMQFVWVSVGLCGLYKGLTPMIPKKRFLLLRMQFVWLSAWGVPGSDAHNHETRFLLLRMQFVWVSAYLHGVYQGLMPHWICFFIVKTMMHRFLLPLVHFVWVSASLRGVYQGLTPTPGSDAHHRV